jgi:hypothetical protein
MSVIKELKVTKETQSKPESGLYSISDRAIESIADKGTRFWVTRFIKGGDDFSPLKKLLKSIDSDIKEHVKYAENLPDAQELELLKQSTDEGLKCIRQIRLSGNWKEIYYDRNIAAHTQKLETRMQNIEKILPVLIKKSANGRGSWNTAKVRDNCEKAIDAFGIIKHMHEVKKPNYPVHGYNGKTR